MDSDTLVLGGYLQVPRAVRKWWQSARLLPQRIITVSECLTEVEHGPEFSAWHRNPATAATFAGRPVAIGFAAADVAALVTEITRDLEVTRGDAPECLALLVARSPMPPRARLRGFEVIGLEFGMAGVHSWLCHSYEIEVAAALGIRPNRWGLLDNHEQAHLVLAWMMDRPDDQAPEPVFWTVAAIAECGSDGLPRIEHTS